MIALFDQVWDIWKCCEKKWKITFFDQVWDVWKKKWGIQTLLSTNLHSNKRLWSPDSKYVRNWDLPVCRSTTMWQVVASSDPITVTFSKKQKQDIKEDYISKYIFSYNCIGCMVLYCFACALYFDLSNFCNSQSQVGFSNTLCQEGTL